MKIKIAFACIMGLVSTGLISFTLLGINVGFTDKFLAVWLRSWSISYTVVVPAILLIGPRVRLLVEYLFGEKLGE